MTSTPSSLSAARGDAVKAIILAGAGPDFSSGHDVNERDSPIPADPVATLGAGLTTPGIEGRHAFECEAYLGLCRRWRDLPKPTIGQAHGRIIAGGPMLLWPMDLDSRGRDGNICRSRRRLRSQWGGVFLPHVGSRTA